jgi:tetratricopeptide (TPR) repeat protein
MNTAINPVERCLSDLVEHWQHFRAEPSKRLLIWQVPDNAGRMLQCFWEIQKHETPYSTGDLFVVFDTPFENSIQYSRNLKIALAGQHEISRDDLIQQGITPDWNFSPDSFPDSATGFLQALRSFGSNYHKNIDYLVAVFTPQTVTNNKAFTGWLSRTLNTNLPERLRLAIIDSIGTPSFKHLAESHPGLVYIDSPKIDTLTIAQETFAQEAAVGPAAVFRNYLMGVATLLEKGSAEQVKDKAKDALLFARKEKWADQEVVLRMMVAGAFLKEKRFDEAINIYHGARQSALQAVKLEHPAGQQLVLQTWFGEAGAHLAAGNPTVATECYDQAAALAQQIPNLILAIEAFRMGAFCSARINSREAAIERGQKAMAVGEQLKPNARSITTLPLAVVDLLRVIESEQVQSMEHVKFQLDAHIAHLRDTTEQQSIVLEDCTDVSRFRTLEKELVRHEALAEQNAVQALDAVVATASEEFRHIYTSGKALFGKGWPLASPIALPSAPVVSTQGEIKEGVSS